VFNVYKFILQRKTTKLPTPSNNVLPLPAVRLTEHWSTTVCCQAYRSLVWHSQLAGLLITVLPQPAGSPTEQCSATASCQAYWSLVYKQPAVRHNAHWSATACCQAYWSLFPHPAVRPAYFITLLPQPAVKLPDNCSATARWQAHWPMFCHSQQSGLLIAGPPQPGDRLTDHWPATVFC